MRRARRVALLVLAATLLVAIPALAYGPLIPWSPIHPGYQELTLSRARILYPANTTLPDAYRNADAWIHDAEGFYGLPAAKRITIVLCGDWSSFHRFVPWMAANVLAGVSLQTGDAIYITPRVDEKRLDHGEFLRHEIGHSVLARNTSIRTYWAPARYPWFHDGLAVWFGRHRTFGTEAQFFERAHSGGIAPLIVESTKVPDLRYAYMTWRNFMDYLDQTYGHEKFMAFVHAANRDPENMERLFQSHLGVSSADASSSFEAAVLNRSFIPR